jgi:hypothetical protein
MISPQTSGGELPSAGGLILTRQTHTQRLSVRPRARRWHGSGDVAVRARALSHFGSAARSVGQVVDQKGNGTAVPPMNLQTGYTLASPPQTSRVLRAWALLSRGTFSISIFVMDVALIFATSCATGVVYYMLVYGDVGDVPAYILVGGLAASIFAISNVFRGEYRLPNFFAFKPHARRTIQLWNVTLICLDAGLSRTGQPRLLARLAAAVLLRRACRSARAALPDRADHGIGARGRIDHGPAHLPSRHRRAYRRFHPALRALGARP